MTAAYGTHFPGWKSLEGEYRLYRRQRRGERPETFKDWAFRTRLRLPDWPTEVLEKLLAQCERKPLGDGSPLHRAVSQVIARVTDQ
jgi:hypothetical protein